MDGAQTFDPVLKVERFLWPEVCNRLNSRIPQRLDEAAKRLAGVPGSKGRVIGLAGCRRGVGCTTALLCLARRLMGMQISPVLVEGDFLQPALAARLGVHVPTGWDDVLRGHLSLAEAMVFSREDHLALLPLKRAVSDSRKLAGSPILQGCLRVLRQHFPLVLVDLGSVLSPSDSSTTVGLCSFSGLESTLLVCSEMDLASNGWRPALNQLRDESLHPAGIIETFATSHGADF
jgi:Mrp family chromosome partitioning ATPase